MACYTRLPVDRIVSSTVIIRSALRYDVTNMKRELKAYDRIKWLKSEITFYLDNNDDLHSLAVCTRRCGTGRCIRPNICLCEGGTVASTCGSITTKCKALQIEKLLSR